ncbi:hypothetical protein DL93DRAFT_2234334 [Clavulina sp. PMI_390]|nr:hypothetical protein DL93DRAFT_2234334 [Clavulina sp. PMI_390]
MFRWLFGIDSDKHDYLYYQIFLAQRPIPSYRRFTCRHPNETKEASTGRILRRDIPAVRTIGSLVDAVMRIEQFPSESVLEVAIILHRPLRWLTWLDALAGSKDSKYLYYQIFQHGFALAVREQADEKPDSNATVGSVLRLNIAPPKTIADGSGVLRTSKDVRHLA